MAVRQQALQLAARAVEQRLNADTSDNAGPRLPCPCGGEARYAGRRSKHFHSALGSLHLQRAYYHCRSCGGGFCPRDRTLGLENSSLSPAVIRMVGTVGALVSFQEGRTLLQELAGVAVDAKQVERTAEDLGAEIAADERQDTLPAHEDLPLPGTLYLGIDGTGIPLRAEELAGRTGKQSDGSAKTREVKLCTVWSAESRDEHGTPVRDEGSVTYSAAIESAATPDTASQRSAFSARVWREATRRRFAASGAPRGLGGWGSLDLERRRRTVSPSPANRRSLPCQRASQQPRQNPLWPRRPAPPRLGPTATSRTGHRPLQRSAGGGPPPCLHL